MTGTVLLVRSEATPDRDGQALAALGFAVVSDPYLRVQTCVDTDAHARAHSLLDALQGAPAWLILASAAGLRALRDLVGDRDVARRLTSVPNLRFAAVGPTSAAALAELGATGVVTPRAHTASSLLDRLAAEAPARAVLPRSSIADAVIPQTLHARGWEVVAQTLYETSPVAVAPRTVEALRSGEFSAIVLRSPSAARAVARFAGSLPTSTRVVAGGPTTALAASRLGMRVCAVADDATAEGIARAVVRAESATKGGPRG